MDDEGLKHLVYLYVQGMSDMRGSKKNAKEQRSREKESRVNIINAMRDRKLSCIDVQPKGYLVLQKKKKKPPLNEEFLTQAYFDFHRDPQRTQGDLKHIASVFWKYVLGLQRRHSKMVDDLRLVNNKPRSVVIQEEFQSLVVS